MTTKIIDNNGIVSLGSILSENDLNIKARVNINPPPDDGRCDCCGKHISELTPFGKTIDPLNGDFDGEFLIKNFRRMGPYDEEASRAWYEAMKHMAITGQKDNDPLDWMIETYGKDKGEHLYWADQAYNQIGSSWECSDCAVLDTVEYFNKLQEGN
jgi:hypothetical protein